MKLALTLSLASVALGFAAAGAADAAVTATLKGAKLVVLSDDAADVIHVDGAGALGEVVVLAGTSPLLVGSFVGIRDVEIKTGAGDDTVYVSCLEIGGSLKAKLGAGDDTFKMDTTLSDGITNRASFIGGSVDAALGGQIADSFNCSPSSFDESILIAKNLTIRDAAEVRVDGFGQSPNSEPANIFIGGKLSVECGDHPVSLTFDDVNVGGTTRLKFSAGADETFISDSHFARAFEAKFGGGDDSIDFDDAGSTFNASAVLDGGSGTDSIAKNSHLNFAAPPTTKNFEIVP